MISCYFILISLLEFIAKCGRAGTVGSPSFTIHEPAMEHPTTLSFLFQNWLDYTLQTQTQLRPPSLTIHAPTMECLPLPVISSRIDWCLLLRICSVLIVVSIDVAGDRVKVHLSSSWAYNEQISHLSKSLNHMLVYEFCFLIFELCDECYLWSVKTECWFLDCFLI